ncbi:hypothetical protein JCM10369A_28250 [Nocardioides pyridinolyticus]
MNASGGVHLRGTLRVGAAFFTTGLLARGVEVRAVARGGGGAGGLPWMQVDFGRSHRSQ